MPRSQAPPHEMSLPPVSVEIEKWVGKPFRHGPWRGRSYPPWSEALLPRLEDWLAEPSPRGTVVKPGVVWRCEDWAVKRFPAARPRFWRSPPSILAAERFRTVWPIPSPRPWLALTHEDGRGLLVSDFIAGESFLDLFGRRSPGMDAFPAFMAEMHRHNVFHGDLNCQNMLWNGERWVLIDLDGLRTGLHRWRRSHLIRRQWAQLYAFRDFSPAIRDSFWHYYELMHPGRSPEEDWHEVEARARALPRNWHAKRNPKRRLRPNKPGHPG